MSVGLLFLIGLTNWNQPQGAEQEPGQIDHVQEIEALVREHYDLLEAQSLEKELSRISGVLSGKELSTEESLELQRTLESFIKRQARWLNMVASTAKREQASTIEEQVKKKWEFPSRFRKSHSQRVLGALSNIIDERFGHPKPSPEDVESLKSQIATLRQEINASARLVVYGPFSGSLIDKAAAATFNSMIKKAGRRSSGGLYRPLNDAELESIVRSVRSYVTGKMPANVGADVMKLEREPNEEETKALDYVAELCEMARAIYKLQFPKSTSYGKYLGSFLDELHTWEKTTRSEAKVLREHLAQKKLKALKYDPESGLVKESDQAPDGIDVGAKTNTKLTETENPDAPKFLGRYLTIGGILALLLGLMILQFWRMKRNRLDQQ